jgi:hypothetical protein
MKKQFVIGAMALGLTAGGAGAAVAATSGPPPTHANITAVQKVVFKVNRYVKDSLRWNKDVYQVKSGGTLHVVNKAHDGPHTFSVVKKSDLPKTQKQLNQCAICETIGIAHGAPQGESDAPPTHLWTEDGVGQDTPADFDKPGDSAFIGPDPGSSVDLKVTAKKGTTLYFLCAIHPWMQGKVIVG